MVAFVLLTGALGIWADFLSVQSKLHCSLQGELEIPGAYRVAVANVAVRREDRTLSDDQEKVAERVNGLLFEQVSAAYRDQGPKVGVGRLCDHAVQEHDGERERATYLAEVKETLEADVVVSATLIPEPQRFTVEIELSISSPGAWNEAAELAADPVFDEASIGTALEVQNKADASVAEMLAPYLKLLQAIAFYANQNWNAVTESLSTALADPQAPGNLKTLAHVLTGNALGRLDRQTDAEASYNEALKINRDYVRAILGLAEIDYQRAIALNETCSSTRSPESLSYLDAAEAKYRKVLTMVQRGGLYDADVRAKYGTGRIHTCKLMLGDGREAEPAIRDLQDVTRRYEADRRKTWIRSVAAGAYGELGLVRCWQGFPDVALDDYGKAQELAVDDKRADTYKRAIRRINGSPKACSGR